MSLCYVNTADVTSFQVVRYVSENIRKPNSQQAKGFKKRSHVDLTEAYARGVNRNKKNIPCSQDQALSKNEENSVKPNKINDAVDSSGIRKKQTGFVNAGRTGSSS